MGEPFIVTWRFFSSHIEVAKWAYTQQEVGGVCLMEKFLDWFWYVLSLCYIDLKWAKSVSQSCDLFQVIIDFICKIIASFKYEAHAITVPPLNFFLLASFKLLALPKHWPFLSLKAAWWNYKPVCTDEIICSNGDTDIENRLMDMWWWGMEREGYMDRVTWEHILPYVK